MTVERNNIGIILNGDQEFALKEILEWLASSEGDDAIILEGYSGCGKTTLVKEIVRTHPNSILTAPTNKAVNVLSRLGTYCSCMTIQSLLGLAMKANGDTKELKEDKDKIKLNGRKIVVIDEASMIDKSLFKFIQRAMKKYKLKVLFIGDPEQLPPVNEKKSKVWNSYLTFYLTKVMRHDNQILNLATYIRETESYDDLELSSDFDKNGGVYIFDEQNFIESIIYYAKKGYFLSKSVKVIAWRNSTVNKYNQIIRESILGKEAFKSKYVVGERVIFTEPYGATITTDMEGIIQSIQRDVFKVFIDNYKTFKFNLDILVMEIKLDNGELVSSIKVIGDAGLDAFNDHLEYLAREAYENRHKWVEFWNFKDRFALIRHAYAITAHRSQGSTFDEIFVDNIDIGKNRERKDAKKCLYVSATRPTTRVFLLDE
jgi:ATP-dependent exoDNAse (exonuclease V) alpha subunit